MQRLQLQRKGTASDTMTPHNTGILSDTAVRTSYIGTRTAVHSLDGRHCSARGCSSAPWAGVSVLQFMLTSLSAPQQGGAVIYLRFADTRRT